MAEEDKAAASMHFYTESRAGSGSPRVRRQPAKSHVREHATAQPDHCDQAEASPGVVRPDEAGAAENLTRPDPVPAREGEVGPDQAGPRGPTRGADASEAGPSKDALAGSANAAHYGAVSHADGNAVPMTAGLAGACARNMAHLPVAFHSQARFDCFMRVCL